MNLNWKHAVLGILIVAPWIVTIKVTNHTSDALDRANYDLKFITSNSYKIGCLDQNIEEKATRRAEVIEKCRKLAEEYSKVYKDISNLRF